MRPGWLRYLSSAPAAGYFGGTEVCSPFVALHSPCPVVLRCCGSPGFPCEALRWPWSRLWVSVSQRGPHCRWLWRTLWANRVSHDWEGYQLQRKKTLARKPLLTGFLNHCPAGPVPRGWGGVVCQTRATLQMILAGLCCPWGAATPKKHAW